jgi:hypothetical protein
VSPTRGALKNYFTKGAQKAKQLIHKRSSKKLNGYFTRGARKNGFLLEEIKN